jgi:hypothetical protein
LTVVPGYINGYTLSNDTTTPNTVLDVAAGVAADSTNAAMINGTALTKSIGSTWAAGSGNGGMGAGLSVAASTWYHVFAIITNGSFDVYFDTSPTAANAPSGTTYHRYIGSIKTNTSSQITAFTQTGQLFQWALPTTDLSGGTATSNTNVTLSTPPGIVTYAKLLVSLTSTAAGAAVYIWNTAETFITFKLSNNVASQTIESPYEAVTSTSSQIIYFVTGTSPSATIQTNGYINPHVAPNW